jgi:hypothetical protein
VGKYRFGELLGESVGLPTHFDEGIEAFTAPGRNGWIIGWHPNALRQLRIKVMRLHREGDLWPDIKREC